MQQNRKTATCSLVCKKKGAAVWQTAIRLLMIPYCSRESLAKDFGQ